MHLTDEQGTGAETVSACRQQWAREGQSLPFAEKHKYSSVNPVILSLNNISVGGPACGKSYDCKVCRVSHVSCATKGECAPKNRECEGSNRHGGNISAMASGHQGAHDMLHPGSLMPFIASSSLHLQVPILVSSFSAGVMKYLDKRT